MDLYKIIKEYYDKGFYTDAQLDVFVAKGKITKKVKTELVKGAAK